MTVANAGRSSHLSTLINHQQNVNRTKQAEQYATESLSSRQKPGGYMNEEVAQHTRSVLKAEQHIEENTNTQSKKTTVTNRIKASLRGGKDLEKIARDFHARVTSAQQTATNDNGFKTFCSEKLKEVEAILNRKDHDGRGLHGGKATQTDAVSLASAGIPGPSATPDDSYNSYFTGEASLHTSTLNDENLEYGFHALEPGVRDLIFYLKSGSVTTPDHTLGSTNTQRLKGMQDGLHDTIKGITQIQENLGIQLGKVERITDSAQENSDDSKDTLENIIGVSEWEAWTQKQEAANQLQLMQTLFAQETRRMKELFQNI